MIKVNLNKAKEIAHEHRRAARAEEFKPYDEVIMKQIPGNDMTEAEAARQTIRDKYATIQANIESATEVEELKEILTTMTE